MLLERHLLLGEKAPSCRLYGDWAYVSSRKNNKKERCAPTRWAMALKSVLIGPHINNDQSLVG